jgi:DNA-binding transcriptional MerR regulator
VTERKERRVTQPALTIDELAARTGVASRTIREYQSVGVLRPPQRVGRVGRYDDDHVRRLDAIAQLQQRGYSLAGIRDLFDAWESGRSLTAVLGVEAGAIASSADERPAVFSAEQLERFVPGLTRRRRLRDKALQCGLIEKYGDDWCVRSQSLLQLVADTTAMGVSAERALDVAVALADAAASVAQRATQLFVDDIWRPHADAGCPDDARDRIEAYLRRSRAMLQRAASSTLIGAVERAYDAAADVPAADELSRLLGGLHVGVVDDHTAAGGTA